MDVPTASATKTLGGQDKWSIGTNGFVVNDGAAMPLREHESFVHLETDDFDSFLAACQGVDTVVHLAADPRPNGDFHTSLLPSNVVGVYNAFEAALQAGCKRVLFASSVHAMLGYKIDWGEAAPARPQTTRNHPTRRTPTAPPRRGARPCAASTPTQTVSPVLPCG